MAATTAPALDIIVAYAAPAIPILKTTIKSRSRNTFDIVEVFRNINGVRESPRPRSIALIQIKA